MFTSQAHLHVAPPRAQTGLVVSVGGLTESLVRHASGALLAFLRSGADTDVEQLGAALLAVCHANAKVCALVASVLPVVFAQPMAFVCLARFAWSRLTVSSSPS